MKEVLSGGRSPVDKEELVYSNSFLESHGVRAKSVFHFIGICPPFASHEYADAILADKLNDHQTQLRDAAPTICVLS